MNDLQKLFLSELQLTYDAGQEFVTALRDMENSSVSAEVKRRFEEAAELAKGQVHRLEEVFDSVGQEPRNRTCHGMRGILQEGQLLADELQGQEAIDSALIAVAEKAEHLRVSAYGTLAAWAEELGYTRAGDLLKQGVAESKQAKEKFNRCADSVQSTELQGDRDVERLFVRQLRQLYDGENLLVSALAEVAFYAESALLKFAVRHHRAQTEKHVRRLEEAFVELHETADRRPCDGIEGLIDDAQVFVMEFLGNAALDAALIASAQKIEHYEMGAYENLCRWAAQLRRDKIVHLLQENLRDETLTDKELTLAAELLRNRKARRSDSKKQRGRTAEFLKLATHGA